MLPELGENVTSGDVSRVLVKVGDTIARDQPVIEIETDKATVEVPSSVEGTVTKINVKQGDKIKTGTVVLTVDTAEGEKGSTGSKGSIGATGSGSSGSSDAPVEPEPIEPVEPEPIEPDEPEPIEPDEPLEPVEPIPDRGRKVVPISRQPGARGPSVPASPMVRRIAREIGVDVEQVPGTGPEGRISQEDVKAQAHRILTSIPSGRGAALAAGKPLPDFSKWGEVDRQPMSSIRRATAAHLSHAWRDIPHVTQVEKADITQMEALRKEFSADVERRGGKLTMTAVLVKVLAAAVKQFPQFNASVDMDAEAIVYKNYVNVGVAVDTERGLLVPVIRDADQKGLTEIAIEIQQLAGKARDKKLTLDEMSGGGISISNLGGIGGTHFTPIVNWPEVAILGVSRGAMEPIYQKDGSFAPRLMLPLSLSYDHRVIDGADAMRFLRWIATALEKPFFLAL
jgi:pyruvate dehydrogenase E2 component (dihydrolipoamide acetyltransferase)